MNKIYRVVWCHSRQQWIVSSEFAKGQTKSTSRSTAEPLKKMVEKSSRGLLAGVLGVTLLASAPMAFAKVGSSVGTGNDVRPSTAVGIGVDSTIEEGADNALALGLNNTISSGAANSIVMGANSEVTASGTSAVVIGSSSSAGGANSLIFGTNAKTNGKDAVAIGTGSQAIADQSLVLGTGATSHKGKAIAIGSGSDANGEKAVVLGTNASASANDAVAIGTGAQATGVNSVALGTGSVASGSSTATARSAGLSDYNSDTINGVNLQFSTTGHPLGEISVGSVGSERRITNVSAGLIGASSTDAINGSQLYAVATKLGQTENNNTFITNQVSGIDSNVKKGLNFSANSGADVNRQLGDTLAVTGGYSAGGATSGENVTTHTYSDASGKVGIAIELAKDATFDSVTTGNSLLNNQGLTIAGGNSPVTLTGNGLDNGNNKILNVNDGTIASDSKDAVNGSQLYSLRESINNISTGTGTGGGKPWMLSSTSAGETHAAAAIAGNEVNLANTDGNLTIDQQDPDASGKSQLTFGLAKDLTADSVTTGTTTVSDGGVTVSGGDKPVTLTKDGLDNGGNTITNVADGKVGAGSTDAVNGGQLNIVQTQVDKGMTFAGNSGDAVTRKLGDTLAIKGGLDADKASSGQNVITRTSADGLSIELASDANFDSVTTGNTKVSDVGLSVTNPATGSAVNVTGNGLDNGGNKITHVADGEVSTGSTDAVNGGQLSDVKALAGKGWNVSSTSGGIAAAAQQVAPGGEVNFANADGNLTIAQQSDAQGKTALTFGLAKDLTAGSLTTGTTTVSDGGVTVSGGDKPVTLTKDGLDNGGNTITNVADGKVGEGSTDAVNGGQLNTVQTQVDKGMTFAGNSGDAVTRKLGDTLAIKGGLDADKASSGQNVITRTSADGLSIELARDANFDSVTTGGTVVNGAGVTIAGGAAGSAVSLTDKGLNNGGNTLVNVAAGEVSSTSTDAVNGSQLNAVQQQAGKGWNVSSTSGGIAAAAQQVAPGGEVNFANADGNLTIAQQTDAQGKTALTFGLANDLTAGSLTTGTTTVSDGGVTVSGGDKPVTLTKDGLDNGGNTITNVADGKVGAGSTDAVNGGQLNTVQTQVDKGMTFAGNSGDAVTRKLGDTLAIKGGLDADKASSGQNVITRTTADGLSIELASDANFDSVKTGNTTINDGGLSVTNPASGSSVKVTGSGLDNGGNKITNVADGKVGEGSTDAVNGGQLNEVKTVAGKGWNLSTRSGDAVTAAQQVAPGSEVQFANRDGNLTVTPTADASGNTELTFGLAKDLTAGSLTTGGTVISDGGVVIGSGEGAVSLSSGGLNNGGHKVTNVADGDIAANSKDAVNGGQISSLVSNTESKGLNFTANTGAPVHKDLGTTLAVTGAYQGSGETSGENVITKTTDDGLTIELAKDATFSSITTGSSVLNNGGLTIGGGVGTVILSGAGLNNGGNKIINVAAGELNENSADAVNGSQLYKVSQDVSNIKNVTDSGWNISTQTTRGARASAQVSPTSGLTVINTDGNLSIVQQRDEQGGTDLTFGLAPNLTADSVTTGNTTVNTGGVAVKDDAGHATEVSASGMTVSNGSGPSTTVNAGDVTVGNVHVDGSTNTIGGLANTTWTGTATSGQAATEDQLSQAIGQVNEAVNNSGWTVKAQSGSDAKIANNGSVQFTGADDNIKVTQTGKDNNGVVQIALSNDLKVGSVTADTLTAGSTTVNNGGVTITGDTSTVTLTDKGLDNGGNKITHVSGGQLTADSQDVVNGSQLYQTNQRVANLQTESGFFQVDTPAKSRRPTVPGHNAAAGGANALASGDNALAVGNDSRATANNATAVGNRAQASAENALAVGYGAQATHANSVALGAGSRTREGAQSNYQAAFVGQSSSLGEVNIGSRTLSGVAPGRNDDDAANVAQLKAGVAAATNYTDNRFGQAMSHIDHVQNKLRAGVASAMAMAGLPQAYQPGASMFSMSGGTYAGESAMSMGYSTASDNGKWIYKAAASTNTRDDTGATIGIGYQW
ncbi:TPA: YadA-like family protein [Pluralibacter gergoviae]